MDEYRSEYGALWKEPFPESLSAERQRAMKLSAEFLSDDTNGLKALQSLPPGDQDRYMTEEELAQSNPAVNRLIMQSSAIEPQLTEAMSALAGQQCKLFPTT